MLHDEGFEVVPRVIDANQLAELRGSFAMRSGAGERGLLAHPAVKEIAGSQKMVTLMSRHLGASGRPVRAMLFDKTQDTNWLVPWHQDITIAVRDRHDTPGFSPWTLKDGVHHVQPPVEVLEQMLAIRIHLDDCDNTNGALKVLPGSHLEGRLDAAAIQNWRERSVETLCSVKAGDALLMRPLLLHASSRSITGASRRRVLHIEYACCVLPPPLFWNDFTQPG